MYVISEVYFKNNYSNDVRNGFGNFFNVIKIMNFFYRIKLTLSHPFIVESYFPNFYNSVMKIYRRIYECYIQYYILLLIGRESIVLGSNFQSWDFDEFTRFEDS